MRAGRLVWIFTLGILIYACAHTSSTRRSMSAGERVFRAKCRSCHVLPDPQDRTANEWRDFLQDHPGTKKLLEEDRGNLLEYLQSAH